MPSNQEEPKRNADDQCAGGWWACWQLPSPWRRPPRRRRLPRGGHNPGLGVRVAGTIAVARSHVGVIVTAPGSDGPLARKPSGCGRTGSESGPVDPLPASALRIGVVLDVPAGDQLQGAQNAVADLMIGLPNGAQAALVGARPARVVQPLTGDTGSVVRALSDARFSGPRDDASALALAVREVAGGPSGRRAVVRSRLIRSPRLWRARCPGRFVPQMPACTSPPFRESRRRWRGWPARAEAGRSPQRPPAPSCLPSTRSALTSFTSTGWCTPPLIRR